MFIGFQKTECSPKHYGGGSRMVMLLKMQELQKIKLCEKLPGEYDANSDVAGSCQKPQRNLLKLDGFCGHSFWNWRAHACY